MSKDSKSVVQSIQSSCPHSGYPSTRCLGWGLFLLQRTGEMEPSKYIGIKWNRKRRSWEILDPQSGEIIGRTRDEIRAAKEYDEFVLLKYGLESKTNFPVEEYKLAIEFGKDAICSRC